MDLYLDIGSARGRSLRERVQNALRDAVRSGCLVAGTRLPSTRSLSAALGVSRGVVSDAYAQLAAEGYLHARPGAGTTVASTVSPDLTAEPRAQPQEPIRYDLNPFRPSLSGFPRSVWLAALARVLRTAPDELLGYPDPAGMPQLRTALASYLGRVRGVRVEPEHVVVTNGLRQGLSLLWHTLATQGSRTVAIENPGWRGMAETAAAAGFDVVRLPVDGEGLLTGQLLERDDIDVVAVAPAHQYPTGAVLSPSRRTALLDWARRTGGLIVEDDYDAEYRYDRKPIGSLQGLAPEHVIYGGSTSKTIAPAVRVGWLVPPRRLAAALYDVQRLCGGMPAPLEQLALADLIERGELDRHLRRQRSRYRRRRDALLRAFATELPGVSVDGAAAGLFAVLHLPSDVDEQAVLANAHAKGIAVEGLGGRPPGLAVGYANLAEAAAPGAVRALAASIDATMKGAQIRA